MNRALCWAVLCCAAGSTAEAQVGGGVGIAPPGVLGSPVGYYEGTVRNRTRYYTNRPELRMVMSSRTDFWLVADLDGKVRGSGLAVYDFDFAFDWPRAQKDGLRTANAMGLALSPAVTITLDPTKAAHRFDVTGELVPSQPSPRQGVPPTPPKLKLKFAWRDKAELRLTLVGTPAGSGKPTGRGRGDPAPGTVQQELVVPATLPFASNELDLDLKRDDAGQLWSGRFDFDGNGSSPIVTIFVECLLDQRLDYGFLNPKIGPRVSTPLGLYEGFLRQQTRYFTDRDFVSMVLKDGGDFWFTIDAEGKVRGEGAVRYALDFGIDWTMAKKVGVSMAKVLGAPIDPDVTIELEPRAAPYRFHIDGDLVRTGSPDRPEPAPDEVTLKLRFRWDDSSRWLRLNVVAALSGAPPAMVGAMIGAAHGSTVLQRIQDDPPSPFGGERFEVTLKKRTPYGPYAWEWQRDGAGEAAATKSTTVVLAWQKQVYAELSPCPPAWVPDPFRAAGATIPFEAKLVGRGTTPARWRFRIEDGSRQRGTCNNEELPASLVRQWQGRIRDDGPDLLFDFRRYDGRREPRFKPVTDEPWNVLETVEPSVDPVTFQVSCLDYGAYGRLVAEVDFGHGWMPAIVRRTNEPVAHIPWAENAWLAQTHIASTATTHRGDRKYQNRSRSEDLDDVPVGRRECRGDGFSNFEEYRGFVVRDGGQKHLRLDPDRKDLFLFLSPTGARRLWPHVWNFMTSSGLTVHRVGDDALAKYVRFDTRIVNYLSDEAESKPQRALFLRTAHLPGGVNGQVLPEGTFGPPKNVTVVEIDWHDCLSLEQFHGPDLFYWPGFTTRVVTHELGHAVGMRHHGDRDFDLASGERIAVEGGQTSGDVGCAMRYMSATYFQHYAPGSQPAAGASPLAHLVRPFEPDLHDFDLKKQFAGQDFCTSPTGTGINQVTSPPHDADGNPRYYCGDAMPGRGHCLAQIVVNDQCGAGGGGSNRDRGATGAPGGEAGSTPVPDDDAERRAEAGRRRHGLTLDVAPASGQSLEIVPGEAVTLELDVAPFEESERSGDADDEPNGRGPQIVALGGPDKPWFAQVVWHTLDSEGRLVPAPGTWRPAGPVRHLPARDPKTRAMAPPTASLAPQIALAPGKTDVATFVLDAADSAKLPAGPLRLFAAIPHPSPKKGEAAEPIVSRSVTLTVRDPDQLPAERRARLDVQRTLSLARAAHAARRDDECVAAAKAVLERDADSQEAHRLQASGLERAERFREALEAYRQALACFRRTHPRAAESPVALEFAIQRLRRQLGLPLVVPEAAARRAAAVTPFAEAAFGAETSTGRVGPPFPADAKSIAVSWTLTETAAKSPAEARWIVVDDGGLHDPEAALPAKAITANERATTVEFPRGDDGFRPGTYRLELWHDRRLWGAIPFRVVAADAKKQ